MEGGDLANSVTPRLLFLWERVVADLPKDHRTHEDVLVRFRRWHRACGLWDINPLIKAHIWDLWLRYDLRVDVVVTSRPAAFADEVTARLDQEDVPVKRVFAMESHVLARKLVMMPDVKAVFFGDRNQQFTFGHYGRFVPDHGRNFSPLS